MFYKLIIDDYLIGVTSEYVKYGEEIAEAEYNKLLDIIQTAPEAPDGYQHKLRADNLEWELVELPPIEPEPLTEEEALTRYANSITGASDTDLISAAETLIEQRIKEES